MLFIKIFMIIHLLNYINHYYFNPFLLDLNLMIFSALYLLKIMKEFS
jgi:hypothetical protein